MTRTSKKQQLYKKNKRQERVKINKVIVSLPKLLRFELVTTSLEFEYSTSNSPVTPLRLSCQIFTSQSEAETTANVNKR